MEVATVLDSLVHGFHVLHCDSSLSRKPSAEQVHNYEDFYFPYRC